MTKVTVCIPARNEIYLNNTIEEVFTKAAGEVECIVGMDGTWEYPLPPDRDGLTVIHYGKRRGHRALMNAAACIGTGDYWMKLDAHCMLGEGYDEFLKAECDVDWMVTPRRYSLDFEKWQRAIKRPVDYEYIRYPYTADGIFIGTTAVYYWMVRQRQRKTIAVDENMICQGSCMFMPMKYFRDLIYPMDEVNYGPYIGEQFEIGMKVWLSGGRCMVNKNTWYAHLWKGDAYKLRYLQERGEHLPKRDEHDSRAAGIDYQTRYWLGNQWPDRIHDFDWLLDRFWPVPGWPDERDKWTL